MMTEAEYRALDQLSQSECKMILDNSIQDWHYKRTAVREETPAMLRGTIAHKAIELGHDKVFAEEYAVDRWPSLTGQTRTKKGMIDGVEMGYQAYKKELMESGKKFIKEEEINQIEGMLESVERDFRRLISSGSAEHAITDIEIEGVKCKGLIDHLPDSKYIFDYKTTGKKLDDKQLWRFIHFDMWKLQAAFYHDLVLKKYGQSRAVVYLIVADYKPHVTRKLVIEPYSEAMDQGREAYLSALEIYKTYKHADTKDLPPLEIYKTAEMERLR